MISDERLRLAAQKADKALADSLPSPEDCPHTFSPEFERKIQRLIRKSKHFGFYKSLKQAACFFLALLLSGTVFLTVNAEAREVIFGWVSQRFEDSQHYFFSGHSEETSFNIQYSLPNVPEGYEIWESYEENNGWTTLYINENDDFLDFGYRREPTDGLTADLFFTVDGMSKNILCVNDMPAEYYQDDTGKSSNLIVWFDSETNTLFYISGYLDKEQMIRLAESVIPDEK